MVWHPNPLKSSKRVSLEFYHFYVSMKVKPDGNSSPPRQIHDSRKYLTALETGFSLYLDFFKNPFEGICVNI